MKNRHSVVIAFTLALGAALSAPLIVPTAWGQPGFRWRGGGGWGHGGAYGRLFDPKTVETVTGEITAVEVFTPMKPMGGGIHLRVKTAKETLSIHLGPVWYIENQDIKLEPRDKVEITGSRVSFEGKPAIIAAEVKKGDAVLKLRDEKGIPYWAGWRQR